MELTPDEPPGRITRKLRVYVSEIERLRTEGYTIEAIRKTLQEVGVIVGWSTVQREAARAGQSRSSQLKNSFSPNAKNTVPGKPNSSGAKPSADTFFAAHTNNRLLNRNK